MTNDKTSLFTWTLAAVILVTLALSLWFGVISVGGTGVLPGIGTAIASVGILVLTAFLVFMLDLKARKQAFDSLRFIQLLFAMLIVAAIIFVCCIISPDIRASLVGNLNFLLYPVLFIFLGALVYFEYLGLPGRD